MAASPLMRLYRLRDAIASGPSLLALAALIGLQYDRTVVVHYKDEKKPVEVKLIDVAPEPPKPVPPPPEPTPPTPQKAQTQPTEPAKPAPQAPDVVTTNAPSSVSAPPAPAPVAPPAPPAKVEPAPPPRPVAANLEGDYIAKVRGYLNASKRYPTGREASLQHPRGTVKVWFILRRDGSLVDSGIEESSNNMLLDDAARKTVNRATYPAFPESSWGGEATHRFTTELEFVPPGASAG